MSANSPIRNRPIAPQEVIPAELRLLAACCRWPSCEARHTAIRDGAAGVDWERFAQTVQWQRVAGLAENGLTQAGVSMPAPIAQILRQRAKDAARQSLNLAAQALHLQRLLDEAAIPCRFLKGTALAQLAYGNIAIKQAWDIDVLIPRTRLLQACSVLHSDGYQRLTPRGGDDEHFFAWSEFGNEAMFRRQRDGTIVELHWRLFEDKDLLGHISAESAMQKIEISPGQFLRTLSDEDLLAYLCMHGARHTWARLKWLADLGAWLGAMAPDKITRLHAATKNLGAGKAIDHALLLCTQLLATPLPAALEASLDADKTLRALSAVALHEMIKTGTTAKGRLVYSLGAYIRHYLVILGPRQWPRLLRVHCVAAADYHAFPLPRPLHFLYPLIRIPSWLWRRWRRETFE